MKKLFLLLTLFSMVFSNIQITFSESPSSETLNFPNARSYILIDSKSGQVLYEHNAHQKVYPASTTKIMTAIVALEKGNLNQITTASEAAVYDIGDGGMNIGIMAGEELRLEELLNAMLIVSANETANIIAETISPTRKDFIELMNQKARELGAENTNFVTTCGIHSSNHYTTASDFAKFAHFAMQIPKFREIVSKTSFNMSPTNKHSTWNPLYTTNKLFRQKSDYYTQVIGVKTGYTSQAGHCLVSAAQNNDGVELIAVVFGVQGPDSKSNILTYSKKLLEYGFRNYAMQNVTNTHQFIKNVPVANSNENTSLNLVTASEFKVLLPNDKSSWNLTTRETVNSSIKAPIKQGDILGRVEYERSGIILGKVDLIASAPVEESIKAQTVSTAKNVFHDSRFRKVLIGAVLLITAFLVLRTSLRRASKNMNIRSDEQQ